VRTTAATNSNKSSKRHQANLNHKISSPHQPPHNNSNSTTNPHSLLSRSKTLTANFTCCSYCNCQPKSSSTPISKTYARPRPMPSPPRQPQLSRKKRKNSFSTINCENKSVKHAIATNGSTRLNYMSIKIVLLS